MPADLNIPIGRVEFFGQVLNIVEHEGRLVAAATDESGMPYEALSSLFVDRGGCRFLMREALDLLLDAAELSLNLTAFAAQSVERKGATDLGPVACRKRPSGTPCRTRQRSLRSSATILNSEP